MKIFLYFKKNYSVLLILLIVFFFIGRVTVQHKWSYINRIIEWDVKSYYAYLPAAFIYDDLTFEFIHNNENSDFLIKEIWPIKVSETGKLIIKTSMGMSYLYLPAFFVAHVIAEPLGFKATGYSKPYDMSIMYLAIIYLFFGLIYLRKLLAFLKYNELTIFITLLTVTIGTNLYYYTIFESGMTHVYNFTLITIFTYNTTLWWNNKRIKNLIYIGLLGGLITLIRPTNIFVYLIFIFWGVDSLVRIKERLMFLIKKIKLSLMLVILYLIPWIPQLIFWKIQTGHFLYFSYGEGSEQFFFNNPQIFNILFSYWKGWYLYTPVMLVATLGLITLFKKNKGQSILILFYLSIMIYILSSWWSWWFGGGYGNRAFIDFYGLMSIPLSSIIVFFTKRKYTRIPFFIVLSVLIWYNNFQITQYLTGALHYWSMTKEMYWEQFLKKNRTDHFKDIVMIPDHKAAHEGIFKLVPEKKEGVNTIIKQEIFKVENNNRVGNYSKKHYFEHLNREMNNAIKNNNNSFKLFNKHIINPIEFNDILFFEAKLFIENKIDSIYIIFNISEFNSNSNCNIVFSIEKGDVTKYRKDILLTNNKKFEEFFTLPQDIMPTDLIKVYICQPNNKNSFIIKNAFIRFNND